MRHAGCINGMHIELSGKPEGDWGITKNWVIKTE